MKCEEVETKLIDYLDGLLEPHERELVENHLEGCERCMDQANDFQKIFHEIFQSKMEMPDESLRINFYHMLHSEIAKQKGTRNNGYKRPEIPFSRIAAGLALLVAGTFLGMMLNPLLKNNNQTELKQLKSEVQSMKEVVMMNMLNEDSPSERIKAVNYADQITPNDKVVEALVKTLNTDKNVNVRMAAAYSLSRFTGREDVLDSLVKSLEKQTDPIIQVVLMDILVQKHETRAVQPMKDLISNDKTIKEVKEIARKNVQVLL